MAVIVTAVGEDRPGLTQGLAEAIQTAGGNWLESQFARLGGQYVGSVLVEIADDKVSSLEAAVKASEEAGFRVSILPAATGEPLSGERLAFDLVGEDRPGIVREVATALASLEVNIEDLETSAEDSAMFGEKLFKARVRAIVPPGTPVQRVRDALEAISGDIMVDFEDPA